MSTRRQGAHRVSRRRMLLEPLEHRQLLVGAIITEFMALNESSLIDEDGEASDWIEINNPTGSPISLDGWYLTDDPAELDKWQFPDVSLTPGEFLIVFASDKNRSVAGSELHANFKLSSLGDSVLLVMPDGATIAHGYQDYPEQYANISYGVPVQGVANPLVSPGHEVTFHVPTPGDADLLPETGVSEGWTAVDFNDTQWNDSVTLNQSSVAITEVFTGDTDWIELQNVTSQSVDTTGWSVLVNDTSSGDINAVNGVVWSLPATVAAGQVLYRSDDASDNYWGSDIVWDNGDGWAIILDDDGNIVDFFAWGYSDVEIATINITAGGFSNITIGTQWLGPGASGTNNPDNSVPLELMQIDHTWSYEESNTDLSSAWREPGYDDSTWQSGAALLYAESSALPAPVNTPLTLGASTYYFRSHFQLDAVPDTVTQLEAFTVLDDGAVMYINGTEVLRIGMPTGPIGHTTPADRTTGDAVYEGPLTIPTDVLVQGDNVIAVEVHQAENDNSDVVFGMALDAAVVVPLIQRVGSTDTNTTDDFVNGLVETKGLPNAGMVVPFVSGEVPAVTGLGFSDNSSPIDALISTDLGRAMQGTNASLWTRFDFDVVDASIYERLTLRIQYDDGFIAYVNGTEVARRNADHPLAVDVAASAEHPDAQAVIFEEIDLSDHVGLLQSGANVLAIHAMNVSAADSDFLLVPELSAVGNDSPLYFTRATPGRVNNLSIADTVRYSQTSRTFTDSITVELTTGLANGQIRYTLDRSLPTLASPLYAAPLNVTNTTQIRAAVFDEFLRPGPVTSETYLKLDNSVLGVTSNLPLVIVDTFGSGVGSGGYTTNFLAAFEPDDDGRSSLTGSIDLATRSGIHVRGSSSAGFPKKNYRVEFWDESNGDYDLPVLGMPREADWILYGPNQYDRAIVNNPLAYELSRQAGQYATRSRWVEVYLNTDGGPVNSSDYVGLYAFMENIKQGDDRVDVEDLSDGSTGPVQGGWIRKIDRGSPYVYPRPDEITPPQQQFIDSYINQFQAALNAPNFADPITGYSAYIDVDSAIDHNLLNMLPMNVDAFRLSGYMFKTQDGKMEFGPNWDYDRAFDSTDGRDNNPQAWSGTGDGTNYFTYGWWNRLFQDANFWQKYIDRWQEWRQTIFSIDSINATIDAMADEIREAAPRDYARWSGSRYGDFQGEIDHLKQWLATRINWIDSRFVSPPIFRSNGDEITPGFQLTMSSSVGEIYYTLDGTDPRSNRGAGISPAAIRYTGPITLTDSTMVRARVYLTGSLRDGAFNGISWSGPTTATYYGEAPPLRITEIMFNPADPSADEIAAGFTDSDDFEFIELQNIGDETIDLDPIRFVNGVSFDFASGHVSTLAPGERVVVVSDEVAFQLRYGSQVNVAGQFVNDSRLANDGERIRLEAALGQEILDFSYDDAWYPTTDGGGFALVIVNELADVGQWGQQSNWRPGDVLNGTPGTDDDGLIPGSIVISELMSNTGDANGDWIELANTTSEPVDISGWFLSDDEDQLTKFQIPANTLIPAGGYVVFNEVEHFGNAGHAGSNVLFEFSRLGERAALSSLDTTTGQAGGYRETVSFAGSEAETTFARYVSAAGYVDFVASAAATMGQSNAAPLVPDVVINELLYNPAASTDDEFIELLNRGTSDVTLYDPARPTNTWRFTNGIDFVFPENVTLGPDAFALIVPIDPGTFRTKYDIPASVQIFGPYAGSLDNGGEVLELSRPGVPGPAPDSVVPNIVVERMRFNDRAPWPDIADGSGPSLSRIDQSSWGNEPTSWGAGTSGGTPGAANMLIDVSPPSAPMNLSISLDAMGQPQLTWTVASDPQSGISLYNVFLNGSLIGTPDTNQFSLTGATFTEPPQFEVSAINGDGLEGPRSTPLTAELIAFQDGLLPDASYNGTRDTVVRQASPTSAAGATATTLEIDGDDPGGTSQDLWGLMKWDVSAIPADSMVLGATITFNVTNEGGPYSAYQMRRDWVEGEATWQEWRNGQAWQVAGGQGTADRGTTALGTFNFSTGLLSFTLNADGVALVQDWIDGTQPNYGFILGDATSTNGLDISSRETGTAMNRPKLSISYIATDTGQAPPTVVSVQTNADQVDPPNLPQGAQSTSWRDQHSELRSIVVTFSTDVTVPVNAVTLTHLGVHADQDPDTPVAISSDLLSVAGNVLTVSLSGIPLEEGVYQLDLADTITDTMGRQLDGDLDGIAGGSYRFVRDGEHALFKLLADWNGDGGVTIFDFPTIAYWFGQPVPTAPAYVDVVADGTITIFDFGFFANRFNDMVQFPAGLQDSLVVSPQIDLQAGVDQSEPTAAQRRPPIQQSVERTTLLDVQPTRPSDTVVLNRGDRGTTKLPELEEVLQSIAEDVFHGWQPR